MPGSEEWAAAPPTWALPVTVTTTPVLMRQGGVLVSVGPVCAYPVGFEFYLTFGFDPGPDAKWRAWAPRDRLLGFHVRRTEEQESATRVVVGFAAGVAADSVACMHRPARPGEPLLRFSGGDSVIHQSAPPLRAESRWWVSPLPPPGRVEFGVLLPGAAGPAGPASMDAVAILEAASRSRALWPAPEAGRRD